MTDLGQSGFTSHAAARLVLAGIESGKSRRLATVGEALGVGIKRQHEGAGALADSRDAVEQGPLLFEVGMLVDMLVNGFNELFNRVVEPIEMLLDIVMDGIAGNAQSVA